MYTQYPLYATASFKGWLVIDILVCPFATLKMNIWKTTLPSHSIYTIGLVLEKKSFSVKDCISYFGINFNDLQIFFLLGSVCELGWGGVGKYLAGSWWHLHQGCKILDQDVFCAASHLTNFGLNKIKMNYNYNHNHTLRSNIVLISRESKDLLSKHLLRFYWFLAHKRSRIYP